MSEFKIPPFVYFYPSLWLNDPEVRRLPPEVKGFYIDLICQLHFSFPYGYCSLLNHKKFSKLQIPVNQNSNPQVTLLVSVSVAEQLKLAENIEMELDKYLPHKIEDIQRWMRVLEERTIVSRTDGGIIYVRKMVKDFKRRLTAYLNGCKGGAPELKMRKTISKKLKNVDDNKLKDNKLQIPVNQNGNQDGYSTANLKYNVLNSGREGVGPAEKKPEFPLQGLYDKTFEELTKISYSKILTLDGFTIWKKFVDWVISKGFEDLFIGEFINPPSFQKIFFDEKFEEEIWEPVIKLILGSGLQKQHNLFYRIPQYMEYYFNGKKPGFAAAKKLVITPKGNFAAMKGVKKNT